jgi:predicted phosphoribosyltransferase
MDAYADRADAGRRLAPDVARALHGAAVAGAAADGAPPAVLALPRGGVPVAAQVAAALGAPLDVLLVRKLGVPQRPELAFGAIATGGVQVLNPEIVIAADLEDDEIEAVARAEAAELARREQRYRGGRPLVDVAGRTLVVVDDGLATGATMRAAVLAVRIRGAAAVVAAAPVGSREAVALLEDEADAVVCPLVPARFRAVGSWYDDFAAVGDDAVCALLEPAGSAVRRS